MQFSKVESLFLPFLWHLECFWYGRAVSSPSFIDLCQWLTFNVSKFYQFHPRRFLSGFALFLWTDSVFIMWLLQLFHFDHFKLLRVGSVLSWSAPIIFFHHYLSHVPGSSCVSAVPSLKHLLLAGLPFVLLHIEER